MTRGHGDYFCRRCGPGDGFIFLQKFHSWDFAQAAREVDAVLGALRVKPAPIARHMMSREDIRKLWEGAAPIASGDAADTYLRDRALDLRWPHALRFIAHWKHAPTQKYLPCMFALFQAPDGELGTLHRTYLAKVTPNKMFLPCKVPIGGAIRLGEVYSTTLGIAEGIETALSASMLFKMPVWATTSERLLREWQPPEGARRITIFADNDANFVGQAAAYHLAHRLVLRHGYRVIVKIPEPEGWDWNDVLKNEIITERYHPDLPELRMQHWDIQSPSQPISDTTAQET